MVINKLIVLVVMLFMSVSTSFASDDPETPLTLPGGKVLSVDEAKTLIGTASLFDMRSAVSYGKGHLKGAVALPYGQKSEKSVDFDASKDKFDMSKLPSDKGAAIIFYSDGPTGWKSYKAAVTAIKAGYTNVMWMRGGTAQWEQKGFPLEQ